MKGVIPVNEVITQATAICGLIMSVVAVIGLIVSAVRKAKAPNVLQNQRLDELEKTVKRHSELFENDLMRFERMEDGNRIMQECMLSLLTHNIDGNDIEGMKEARKNLQKYLINH